MSVRVPGPFHRGEGGHKLHIAHHPLAFRQRHPRVDDAHRSSENTPHTVHLNGHPLRPLRPLAESMPRLEVGDQAVDGLMAMIEPLIMVILVGLIGSVMIAMYMPIFQMGDAVSG